MDMIILKEHLNTFADAFRRIALMLIVAAELISDTAAVVGLLQKILKTDSSDDFMGTVFTKNPITD